MAQMPICLTTERQALEARKRLRNCYICGLPLPEGLTGEQHRSQVVGDHLIPTAILRMAPCSGRDSWVLQLDVHAVCEDFHKDQNDNLAKIILKMGVQGPKGWTRSELKEFQKRCLVTRSDIGASTQPLIETDHTFFLLPHLWARGFHAALYGETAPPEVEQWTGLPVPSFNADHLDPATYITEDWKRTNAVLGTLGRAIAAEQADQVVFRKGAIAYHCVWISVPHESGNRWLCLWALDLPGAHEWSMQVRGQSTPWHGSYELEVKPERAAWIPM
jgi:hypothetical protein